MTQAIECAQEGAVGSHQADTTVGSVLGQCGLGTTLAPGPVPSLAYCYQGQARAPELHAGAGGQEGLQHWVPEVRCPGPAEVDT